MPIPILALSDEVDPRVHSATVRDRLGHVELVVGCGDLPNDYLEFVADALRRPVYYVDGNHVSGLGRDRPLGSVTPPAGAVDLGGRVVRDEATGLIMAGLPGSPRYCDGEASQYREWQVELMVLRMLPRLLWNRLRHGRYLDVLVSHAPALAVDDRPDPAHRGFKAIRTFLERFRPSYHLHGHVHLYDRSQPFQQRFEGTEVINVFPYQELNLEGVGNEFEAARRRGGEAARRGEAATPTWPPRRLAASPPRRLEPPA